MLQIRLGPFRDCDPKQDPLGRHSVGYRSGLTVPQIWETGRGVWVFDPTRAFNEVYVRIVAPDGIVMVVAKIEAIRRHDNRYAIEGQVLEDHDLVGKPTPTPHPSQNPVHYAVN